VDRSTADLVARALRDRNVRKRRPFRSYGVYVDAHQLLVEGRFWADGADVDAHAVDAYITAAGGHRLRRFVWRRPQYFLPGQVYRELRSRCD
jgi:hypothetical protein